MCNPILTFTCVVKNANSIPEVTVEYLLDPSCDRSDCPSVNMPSNLLKENEIDLILKKLTRRELNTLFVNQTPVPNILNLSLREKQALFKEGISEKMRLWLPLRDTDKISKAKSEYKRRGLK